MVGVQDEQHVERLDQARVGLELRLAHLEEHREEVRGVAQVVVGVDVGLALRVAEGPGAQRRHLRDHADDLQVPVVGVGDLAGVGVERRQRADGGHEHAHRVGVVAEALHERLDVLVDERVVGDLVLPRVVLLLGGQLAVDEQVGDLEEVRLLRQLLDGVAAVLEDPLLAVDEGHRAAARGGVGEAGVVDRDAGLVLAGLDLAEVLGLDGAVGDGEVVGLPGAVVPHGQRLVGAGSVCAGVLGSVLGRGIGHVRSWVWWLEAAKGGGRPGGDSPVPTYCPRVPEVKPRPVLTLASHRR